MAPPNYFNHSSSSSPIQLKIKEKPWPTSIPPSQPQIPNKTKNFSFKLNTLLAQPNPKSKMPDQTKQRHLKIQSSPLEKGENNLIVTLPFFFSLLFSIHASMVSHCHASPQKQSPQSSPACLVAANSTSPLTYSAVLFITSTSSPHLNLNSSRYLILISLLTSLFFFPTTEVTELNIKYVYVGM